MPHRSQELIELCVSCKKPAGTHCLCCGTPLCNEHAPQDTDERCRRCEEHYTETTRWLREAADGHLHSQLGRPLTAVLAVGFLIPTAVMLGLSVGGVVGLFVGAAAGVGLSGVWYSKTPPRELAARRMLRKKRKQFLRKRARRLPQLPPAATADG